MKEILKSYEEYLYDSSKSKNTVLAYVTDITLYSKFLLNTKKIEILESDKDCISEYIKYLISQGKSERSVNRIIISIRNFYGFLKKKALIKEVPEITYKTSNLSKKIPEILTVDEIDRIINIVDKDSLKGVRDKALLEIMYATGMKVSELTALKIQDINTEMSFVACKDNKRTDRLIPIGSSAVRALNEYLSERDRVGYLTSPYLFINLNGNKLTRQGVWRIVKSYCERAGIRKSVNLNTFRHSFAVHLLENGANVRAVQKLLGNQVLTYMDTYYEIINSDRLNVIYKRSHPRA
ncbi:MULTISPECIES: tyrosine-type recombinase/integrase [Clostridium]|uniref:Tyrosine-type recombinase/integrase n=2 Tax=Clostridium intestinale TaxID=36845 RepID=A0A7D6ZFC9_9CLOT|nr:MULTISPECIES: tyrosine-type recombinase/integrase [Clostridium]QLY78279.1 tyrosine-type recombinase/integrase [Clostridium intestinale]WRY53352.1 tyrosine-type recombinase/integrase [Clostridium intestinale]SHI17236.1 integrase/recombinase XerD [Clostridium intestinale DSM 6191]